MMTGNEGKKEETFNVVQFFRDDTYEYVREHVDVIEAAEAARHYCSSVAAKIGVTKRVIITDEMDNCVFLWTAKAGIVFPPREIAKPKTNGKHKA